MQQRGQHRTSNVLRKQSVSGSGVRSVWLRHNLENFKKRLKALEEKVARDGIELTGSQIAALERKASDDEACGEIETAHPGYLGSQDIFYAFQPERRWAYLPANIRCSGGLTTSCMSPKRQLQQPICSMTECCHFMSLISVRASRCSALRTYAARTPLRWRSIAFLGRSADSFRALQAIVRKP